MNSQKNDENEMNNQHCLELAEMLLKVVDMLNELNTAYGFVPITELADQALSLIVRINEERKPWRVNK